MSFNFKEAPFARLEDEPTEVQWGIANTAIHELHQRLNDRTKALRSVLRDLVAAAQKATSADFDEEGIAELQETLQLASNSAESLVDVVPKTWEVALSNAIETINDEEDYPDDEGPESDPKFDDTSDDEEDEDDTGEDEQQVNTDGGEAREGNDDGGVAYANGLKINDNPFVEGHLYTVWRREWKAAKAADPIGSEIGGPGEDEDDEEDSSWPAPRAEEGIDDSVDGDDTGTGSPLSSDGPEEHKL